MKSVWSPSAVGPSVQRVSAPACPKARRLARVCVLQTPALPCSSVAHPAAAKQKQFGWISRAVAEACGDPPMPTPHTAADVDARRRAERLVDVVVLPEMWNTPYSSNCFAGFAEEIAQLVNQEPLATDSSSCSARLSSSAFLSSLAAFHGVSLLGGSICELETSTGRLFNSSLLFDARGVLRAKHRKVHLFDVDVRPGAAAAGAEGIFFRESATLSAGAEATVCALPPLGLVGVGVCYDLRFAGLASAMSRLGATFLYFPGCFNATTGASKSAQAAHSAARISSGPAPPLPPCAQRP
eukprot:GHVT01081528.1.p1 GENE.GHVT01081528.1~~GHVT01081528.1.p1  ORF type:complete len:297 (-),score=96.08 GHVT01081528.1:362-1252(-)